MKTKFVFAAIVAAWIATSVAFAQTPSETLERAIFAQDAQGNLDAAIQGYRQVANSAVATREIAAHAQYRLSQAMLMKGDLSAATRELERLKKDFAEYGTLIGTLTASLKTVAGAATGAGVPPSLPAPINAATWAMVTEIAKQDPDVGPWVTLRGTVHSGATADQKFVVVESEGRRYAVVLGPSFTNVSSGPISKVTFKLGETVTVDARHPFPQPVSAGGIVGLRAQTITRADGSIIFKR